MKSRLPKNKDFDLWLLLLQARDTLLKARYKELRQYGISPMEAGVLFYFQTNGGKLTPVELSQCLLREHHSITTLLSRMEKKGLITKTKDADRKNIWSINLTEKGQQTYRQSIKRESIHKAMSPLTENECQQLESHLKKVRNQVLKLLVSEPIFPFP